MPNLQINFTGLCLFVRYPGDSHVDVRFITSGPHAGHLQPHFPILAVPANVWKETNQAGSAFPDREAGRPIHLYMYDDLTISCDGTPLAGPVDVIEYASLPNPPRTATNWRDFRFVLDAAHLLPGAHFDHTMAANAAPKGMIRLNGGTLSAGVPTTQAGDFPWSFESGGSVARQAFLTDKTVFTTSFTSSVALTLRFQHGGLATSKIIELESDRDIVLWIAHDPFDLSRLPFNPGPLEHLELFTACFTGVRLPIVKIRPTLRESPDSGSCDSLQVRL